MAKTFRNCSVEQEYLFPRSVQDFVSPDHLCHFIRNLVWEELDFGPILSKYEEERGYPPYDPRMMMATLLYAYSRKVYSSREIATACLERLDFMAVSAMNKPDFRTICKFRKRHSQEIPGLFLQVLLMCQKVGLVKLGHVALDGSKFKANASKSKTKTYESLLKTEELLKAEIEEWNKESEKRDSEEDNEFGEDKKGDEIPPWVANKEERLKKVRMARAELERRDLEARQARKEAEEAGTKPRNREKKRDNPRSTTSYNLTDPDCNKMRTIGHFYPGYNAQLAVDKDSQVIVAGFVCNECTDNNQLIPAIAQIEQNLNRLPRELSADTGYCPEENLKVLKEKGIRGYVSIGSKNPGVSARNISPDSLVAHMGKRIRKAGRRSRYRFRKSTVETVFGIIKAARGFRGFLTRGLENVNTEWTLICTVHNLLKLKAARAA